MSVLIEKLDSLDKILSRDIKAYMRNLIDESNNIAVVFGGGEVTAASFEYGGSELLRFYGLKYQNVSRYSGGSAGAIIAFFNSLGIKCDIDVIKNAKKDVFYLDFKKLILNPKQHIGIFNGSRLEKLILNHINKELPSNSFKNMKKELYITTTLVDFPSLKPLKTVVFSNKNHEWNDKEVTVLDSVIASTRVPILFSSSYINGDYFIDGEILKPVPIEPHLGKADLIFAFSIYNPSGFSILPHVFGKQLFLYGPLDLSFKHRLRKARNEYPDTKIIVFEPDEIIKTFPFDFGKAEYLEEAGALAVYSKLKKLVWPKKAYF